MYRLTAKMTNPITGFIISEMKFIEDGGIQTWGAIIKLGGKLVDAAEMAAFELTQRAGLKFPTSEWWTEWYLGTTAQLLSNLSTGNGKLEFDGNEQFLYTVSCAYRLGQFVAGRMNEGCRERKTFERVSQGLKEIVDTEAEKIDPSDKKWIDHASNLIATAFFAACTENESPDVDMVQAQIDNAISKL